MYIYNFLEQFSLRNENIFAEFSVLINDTTQPMINQGNLLSLAWPTLEKMAIKTQFQV